MAGVWNGCSFHLNRMREVGGFFFFIGLMRFEAKMFLIAQRNRTFPSSGIADKSVAGRGVDDEEPGAEPGVDLAFPNMLLVLLDI